MMAWKFSSEIFRVSGVWTLVDDLDFISTLEDISLGLESGFRVEIGWNPAPLVVKFEFEVSKNLVPSALGFEVKFDIGVFALRSVTVDLWLFGHEILSAFQNFFDTDSQILDSDGLLFGSEHVGFRYFDSSLFLDNRVIGHVDFDD
ncbi:unnamed protein product [Rhizophagus irregularis]|nr:unnamed protein product [Rhizophagus irregularis]